jgi:hypothetical protein
VDGGRVATPAVIELLQRGTRAPLSYLCPVQQIQAAIEYLKGVLKLTAPPSALGAALPLHASPTAPADTWVADLASRRAWGTPGAA